MTGSRRAAALLVGRLTSDFVRVRIPVTPSSPAEDGGSTWVKGQVDIAAGPFRAAYEGTFAFEAFVRFRDALRDIEGAGRSAAPFDPVEPYLAFEVRTNGRRAFVAEGTAYPSPTRAHRLSFSIDLDHADLRDALRSLDRLLEGWPGSGPAPG